MNFQTLLSQASKGTKQEKAPPFSHLKPTTLKTTVTQLSVAKTTLVADRERYSANAQKLLNPKDPLLSVNLLRL